MPNEPIERVRTAIGKGGRTFRPRPSPLDSRPIALTIAGSDSGGGAGIQADLKTFAALGVHGASAIACVTAQNPKHVLAVEACSPGILQRQIEAVFEELRPAAVKTGMLFSLKNIQAVTACFRNSKLKIRNSKLVVDPVMVSTSGAQLLQARAIQILKKGLLPLATVVTPNLDEAGVLTGNKISSIEQMRSAARNIYEHFGCAALVKGGHLKVQSSRFKVQNHLERGTLNVGSDLAVDIFYDGRTELVLRGPLIKGIRTHGTGCTCSAAIAGYLALGFDLVEAVKKSKEFITRTIAGSYRIGKHFALDQNFNLPHST